MKPRIGYFFWILMLAFGLMLLVVAAQELTRQNIYGLKKGNREAVITFTINNSLQDLVNLSFELETKITNSTGSNLKRQSITDSLTMLGYNASVLEQINLNKEVTGRFKKLTAFINQQIELSLNAVETTGAANNEQIDLLRKLEIADSIYSTALSIQKYLEKDLQSTLDNNTAASSRLTAYNRTLAIIAIAAVLILGTIIINRHLRQVQLISELEKATIAAKNSAMIKEQFLANMSHEIRTPLNAIKGFSRLITQTPLNETQQQYADIIDNASDSLIYIVNDILDISKIEAGKLRIEVKEFDLNKTLQTVKYMFVNIAAEKGLQYFQHIAENIPIHLKGDSERLSQILINLISNGIKFTNKGFVRTTVSLHKEEHNTVWIEFILQDSGIGIPADNLDTIFKRFQQLDTNKDSITQGTGLGLSIVKSLTTLMGGFISVSSEYGIGSAFKVVLPFEKGTYKNLAEKSIKNNLLLPADYGTSSILVVEDNKINQLLVQQALKNLGMAVFIVSNGKEAMDLIAKREFDLILLDIQMPVMDGYATIKMIRESQASSVPVVAMTAYATSGEKEKCFAAGMNDYLTKPIDFSELANVIEKFLKLKKNTSTDLENIVVKNDDFLFLLTGGDKKIMRRILEEIILEIPVSVIKLKTVKDNKAFAELKSICHHMASTFSPTGTETIVMKKIKLLGGFENDTGVDVIILIDGLVQELNHLKLEMHFKLQELN